MAELQDIQYCPDSRGGSIAYQVMDDAVRAFLQRGDFTLARSHLDALAGELMYVYDDVKAAYDAALERVDEAERAEHQRQQELGHQQLYEVLSKVIRDHHVLDSQPASVSDESSGRAEATDKLLAVLYTPKAMLIWEKLQAAKFVDDHLQPLLSRPLSAFVAHEIAKCLHIKCMWKVFEAFWHRKNMRSDYNEAMNQRQVLHFQDRLKVILHQNTSE